MVAVVVVEMVVEAAVAVKVLVLPVMVCKFWPYPYLDFNSPSVSPVTNWGI